MSAGPLVPVAAHLCQGNVLPGGGEGPGQSHVGPGADLCDLCVVMDIISKQGGGDREDMGTEHGKIQLHVQGERRKAGFKAKSAIDNLIFLAWKVKVKVIHSCPTLWDPMDYTPMEFSGHGILQARILEWVTFAFARGSS